MYYIEEVYKTVRTICIRGDTHKKCLIFLVVLPLTGWGLTPLTLSKKTHFFLIMEKIHPKEKRKKMSKSELGYSKT